MPGASGTWRDLTDNVNQLAANLTKQVRAIAEVATAVTKGDLTRSISLEAQGEMAALKDTINEMIRNLRDTTQKNAEMTGLRRTLAGSSAECCGDKKDLLTVCLRILPELAPAVSAITGRVLHDGRGGRNRMIRHLSCWPATRTKSGRTSITNSARRRAGPRASARWRRRSISAYRGLADYIKVSSDVGEAKPLNILVQVANRARSAP